MTKGTKNVVGKFKDQINKMYFTIFQVIYIVIFSALAIADLIVGIERKDLCPVQSKIPLWLMVQGGTGIALNGINIIAV